MKKNKSLIIIIVVGVVLLAGAYVIYNMLRVSTGPQSTQNATGQQMTIAPDFTVIDGNGQQVSLSDLAGKPVVLNFWASWCGPCKSEMPGFDEMFAKYGDEIHFMMVNLTDNSRETVEIAQSYIDEEGYSFPVYFDVDGMAAVSYNVMSIPVTYFIDTEGNIVTYSIGAIDASTLQSSVEDLLP